MTTMQGEDHKCLEQIAQYLKDEFKNKRGEEVRLYRNAKFLENSVSCIEPTKLFFD